MDRRKVILKKINEYIEKTIPILEERVLSLPDREKVDVQALDEVFLSLLG